MSCPRNINRSTNKAQTFNAELAYSWLAAPVGCQGQYPEADLWTAVAYRWANFADRNDRLHLVQFEGHRQSHWSGR